MSLIHSTMFIAFLLGAMPSAGGLRNGRLDFGPQGILRLVGVVSMYPTRCNSAALMATGIREDFLEEVSGEQGEKHSGLAHPMFLFLAFAEGSCSGGAWVCQP